VTAVLDKKKLIQPPEKEEKIRFYDGGKNQEISFSRNKNALVIKKLRPQAKKFTIHVPELAEVHIPKTLKSLTINLTGTAFFHPKIATLKNLKEYVYVDRLSYKGTRVGKFSDHFGRVNGQKIQSDHLEVLDVLFECDLDDLAGLKNLKRLRVHRLNIDGNEKNILKKLECLEAYEIIIKGPGFSLPKTLQTFKVEKVTGLKQYGNVLFKNVKNLRKITVEDGSYLDPIKYVSEIRILNVRKGDLDLTGMDNLQQLIVPKYFSNLRIEKKVNFDKLSVEITTPVSKEFSLKKMNVKNLTMTVNGLGRANNINNLQTKKKLPKFQTVIFHKNFRTVPK